MACAECEGISRFFVRAVNFDGLQFTGRCAALSHIAWLHQGQRQVAVGIGRAAKVRCDVGNIRLGQAALQGQQERGAAIAALRGVEADSDVAGPKQGVHGRLQARCEYASVAAVSNGWAVNTGAITQDRDLEMALWNRTVGHQSRDLQAGDVHASQRATKSDGIGIGAVRTDVQRAQATQGAGIAGDSSAQCSLQLGSCGTQGQ